MTPRGTTRLALVALSAALMSAACNSGTTTGEPTASSGSASVADSPAFPSESLPPGVEKDSVLDLNSTKDMTGVVTTVPINKSPYIDHLLDICTLIPDSVMKQLGVSTKKRGFQGTQLISQACVMRAMDDQGAILYTITVGVYTNNIEEILAPTQAVVLDRGISISPKISGTTTKLVPSSKDDETFKTTCGTAWGTFFGSAIVNYRTAAQQADPCAKSTAAARALAPSIPRSPSQMRAAK